MEARTLNWKEHFDNWAKIKSGWFAGKQIWEQNHILQANEYGSTNIVSSRVVPVASSPIFSLPPTTRSPRWFLSSFFHHHRHRLLALFSAHHIQPGLQGGFVFVIITVSSFVISIFSLLPSGKSPRWLVFHGSSCFDQVVTGFGTEYFLLSSFCHTNSCYCHSCHPCHHRRPCRHHRPCHRHYHQIFAIVAIVYILVIAVIIGLLNLWSVSELLV